MKLEFDLTKILFTSLTLPTNENQEIFCQMHSILRGNWIGISGWFFQQYNFLDASRQRNKKKLNSTFRIDAVNFRVWHSEHACCSSISNLFIFYWTWLWVKVQLNKYFLWMITLRSNVDIIWTKSNVLSQNSWIKPRSIKIGWQVLITKLHGFQLEV